MIWRTRLYICEKVLCLFSIQSALLQLNHIQDESKELLQNLFKYVIVQDLFPQNCDRTIIGQYYMQIACVSSAK